ncbi:MAG TPA: sterol desaturase family protein [Bradyrhizobium sp.]|nr:sterol desaturase family protein [Bradyrhizobium sp.]
MHHTKIGYYAELYVYPFVVGGLLLYHVDGSAFAVHRHLWMAAVCGVMLWTLVEYLVHRFVYHKVPLLKDLHGMHHAHPSDLIGSPMWVSAAIFCCMFFLLARLWGTEIACGAMAGLIAGYVWYLVIHDAVHRWQLAENSWLRSHRLRHLRHHRYPVPGNFGVTTSFWDVVFGTAIGPGRARAGRDIYGGPGQLPEQAA